MKCPACSDTTLVMADRQGIEIDYCPQCRGVWLDRGELDKLIERTSAGIAPARQAQPPRQPPCPRNAPRHDDDERGGRRGKRRSLLGELFDF